jgi:hypothetical protein
MRTLFVVVAVIGMGACSRADLQRPDAMVRGPTDPVDGQADFDYLMLVTSGLGDAGDPPIRSMLGVRANGPLEFSEGTGPPRDATMTADEREDFARLLDAPGTLDELLSSTPCGRPWADYNEWLTIGARGRQQVRKEITGCKQTPYAELRAFLFALRDRHFRWTDGGAD